MTPLRILILSDGRPGHFNLSEGIAAALGRLCTTKITRIDVRRGRWPGALLAALTNAHLSAATLLRLVHGLEVKQLPDCDVVISAGAETLAANVWLARQLAIPNVFYGSLRRFRPTDYSVVLTSYARNADQPNHMLALKPSAFDPDNASARPQRHRNTPDHAPPHAALLIGGNAGTFTYTPRDWDPLLAALLRIHAALGTRWLIANSRRTPAAIGDRIAAMASDPASGIERFVDVRTSGPGTLAPLLAAADAVICTEDSSSMISECIWARIPLVGITPIQFHHTPDEAQYRQWLAENGWCRTIPIAELTPDRLLDTLAAITPLTSNPLDDLAQRLAERLAQRLPQLAQASAKGETAKQNPAS